MDDKHKKFTAPIDEALAWHRHASQTSKSSHLHQEAPVNVRDIFGIKSLPLSPASTTKYIHSFLI